MTGADPAPAARRGAPSLSRRLTLAAAVTVTAFFALTGFSLDRAFRDASRAATIARLQAEVYMLLGAAELTGDGSVRLPPALPEPLLSAPGSGLYAELADGSGRVLWRSASSMGVQIAWPVAAEPGRAVVAEGVAAPGERVFALAYPVDWELEHGGVRRFVFRIAESRAGHDAALAGFRASLWGWLGAAALALLVVQALVLRWGLAPLRRAAAEVRRVEAGELDALGADHPRELEPLTGSINALIRSQRARLERYRNALGDLAHSLKTPLAVLRSALEPEPVGRAGRSEALDQVARLQQTVDYHLQRAAAVGRDALTAAIAVEPVLARLVEAMRKVHQARGLAWRLEVAGSPRFAGDEGDLMDLAGNLLDNAGKWARSEVRVEVTGPGGGLRLVVEDDGPGIDPERADELVRRGARADPTRPGHGIGLAVVRELVAVHGGRLAIGRGALGGARVVVELPPAT